MVAAVDGAASPNPSRDPEGPFSEYHPKKAGATRTYEVTLLWLPPPPEDSIPGLVSGLPSEPASSRRGSSDTLESFDPQALIS
jgi:hypothetical protein